MEVWRICKEQHLETTLSGIGAEITGGRWNHKGRKMVYTSSTLSLASLELFVHINRKIIPKNLWTSRIKIPDTVSQKSLSVKELPKNWETYPAPSKLQEIGTYWLQSSSSLLLVVPSVVIPQENNILINPQHPEFKKVKIEESKPFHFDSRMIK